jgi:hypothetical protein
MVHYWVGYAGGPGHLSISELESKGFEKGLWYYPAIRFVYRSRTDRNGQTVGVDLNTERIVFSGPYGLEIPRKLIPSKPP